MPARPQTPRRAAPPACRRTPARGPGGPLLLLPLPLRPARGAGAACARRGPRRATTRRACLPLGGGRQGGGAWTARTAAALHGALRPWRAGGPPCGLSLAGLGRRSHRPPALRLGWPRLARLRGWPLGSGGAGPTRPGLAGRRSRRGGAVSGRRFRPPRRLRLPGGSGGTEGPVVRHWAVGIGRDQHGPGFGGRGRPGEPEHRRLLHLHQPRLQPGRKRGRCRRRRRRAGEGGPVRSGQGGRVVGRQAGARSPASPECLGRALARDAFAGRKDETMGAVGPLGPGRVGEACRQWLQQVEWQGSILLSGCGPRFPCVRWPVPAPAAGRGELFPPSLPEHAGNRSGASAVVISK